MAFTITSQTNLAYNERVECVPGDQLARAGLSQGDQGDLAAKAFGAWSAPQFKLIGQTTAAETGAFTLNLASSTRSVTDQAKQYGPLAGALTSGTVRSLRFRVKQVTGAAANVFWCAATVNGAATPTVTNPATTSVIGTKQNAADIISLSAAAGSVTVNVIAGGAVTTVWTVDVFTDDPC
jgi:hypothetical protein